MPHGSSLPPPPAISALPLGGRANTPARLRRPAAALPAELARPYADAFGLQIVPLADPWARRRFAIATRADDALTPAARLLVEHLGAAGQVEGPNLE